LKAVRKLFLARSDSVFLWRTQDERNGPRVTRIERIDAHQSALIRRIRVIRGPSILFRGFSEHPSENRCLATRVTAQSALEL